jgi:hypothetical protein
MGIRARRAAVSDPSEGKHEERRGQGLDACGGAPVAAHGLHAGLVGKAGEDAEHNGGGGDRGTSLSS